MGPNGEERRVNHRVRDRLTAIQYGYERWMHRSYRGLLTIAVTLIATAAALGYLYSQNRTLLRQIQAERHRAIAATCARDNRQNTAIRRFVAAVAPATFEQRARREFPLANCDTYVRETVKAQP